MFASLLASEYLLLLSNACNFDIKVQIHNFKPSQYAIPVDLIPNNCIRNTQMKPKLDFRKGTVPIFDIHDHCSPAEDIGSLKINIARVKKL